MTGGGRAGCDGVAATELERTALTLRVAGSFPLGIPADAAYALFTPEGERQWAPGWAPLPFAPHAEARPDPGACFLTHVAGDESATWLVTAADAASRAISYRNFRRGLATAIEVTVARRGPDASRVHVAYDWTALGAEGVAVVARRDAAWFAGFLAQWQRWIEDATPSPPCPGDASQRWPALVPPTDPRVQALAASMTDELAARGHHAASGGVDLDALASDALALLCMQGAVPVGLALLAWHDERRWMSLHRLYVVPAARANGAGDWLLAEAERIAQAAGAERLAFRSSRDLAPALALYAKRGYAASAVDARELAFEKRFAA